MKRQEDESKGFLVPDGKFRRLPADGSTLELALARNRRTVVLRDARNPDVVVRFDEQAWEQFVALLQNEHRENSGNEGVV